MKKVFLKLSILLFVVVLAACGGKPIVEEGSSTATEDGKKVGVVFTASGLGDNNFNDMVYEGLKESEEKLGIRFDYSEPSSNGEIATMLREFAQDGSYDLIFALTIDAAPALEEVAPEFPEQKFTIIDTAVEGENIRSIFKNGADQTFLSGALAGLLSKDADFAGKNDKNTLGVIIGNDIPALRANMAGFAAGAKYVNPEIQVLNANVGSFNDPSTATEMALSLNKQGANIILHAAGGSGLGVITVAENQGFYAMGMGVNQNGISPDAMVATATFELPNIVFNEVEDLVNDKWAPGIVTLGLRAGAVGYTVEGSNVVVSDEIIRQVEELKEWYVGTEVELPTTLEEVDSWVAENKK